MPENKTAEVHAPPAKKRKVVSDQAAVIGKFYQLLLNTNVEDFVNEAKTVFVASRTDKIVDVWKGLVQHNFLSVPVLQKTEKKYYGFIDLPDIVRHCVKHFGTDEAKKAESYWLDVAEEKVFGTLTVDDLMKYPISRRNPFHPVTQGYSLLHACELLAKEPALHRVPIISGYPERQLVNLITQSQVVTFLNKHIDYLGDKANKPIKDCPRFFKPVVTVSEDVTAIEAFEQMVSKNISGLAVVDSNGQICDNLSLRDIKLVGYNLTLFWRFYQTVKNFLIKLKREFQEKHNRPRVVMFLSEDDTLGSAIRKLAEYHVHRLYVADKMARPVGVVSLKDVLAEILS